MKVLNNIMINECNLKDDEIKEYKTKARLISVNENNEILVIKYDDVYLLPGGSVNTGEDIKKGLLRELKEELGVNLSEAKLECSTLINFYQRDYIKRNNTKVNRLIQTYYFVTDKEIIPNLAETELTEEEKNSEFKVLRMNIDDLRKLLENYQTDNPRNIFFIEELLYIISIIKVQNNVKVLKKTC